MKPTAKVVIPATVFALLAVIPITGCATKKFVRQTVSPIEQRLGNLDKKTAEHASSIEELDKSVSRANERAMTADSKAESATKQALTAQEQAASAGRAAGDASSLAEKGISNTAEAERRLGKKIDNFENYDNYQLVSTESVQFALGRHELAQEAKQSLDEIAAKIGPMKHYVIEVQGFTDKTGAAQYNLELSRLRAGAVVRYLTLNHKIPLHRIHVMGFGEESPVADNASRDGRKQNRRVEIRTYAAVVNVGAPLISQTDAPKQ